VLLTKIPPYRIFSRAGVVLKEEDEPMVDVSAYTGGKILVDMQYYKHGRPGAIDRALVRRSVADKLLAAARALPQDYRLKILDAWRPVSVQRDIFDEYYHALKSAPENKGLSDGALHDMACRFVSFPQTGERLSFVHSSGGAVDLTLTDRAGNDLDMGCGFDDFAPLAATDALESAPDTPAAKHRRLLYTVMTEAGFTNYPDEWWHYDYGDLFYAAATKSAARYASIFDETEMTYV